MPELVRMIGQKSAVHSTGVMLPGLDVISPVTLAAACLARLEVTPEPRQRSDLSVSQVRSTLGSLQNRVSIRDPT